MLTKKSQKKNSNNFKNNIMKSQINLEMNC